ncbi:MAG: glycosyltransferase family 39 protein [Bacteroidales bacterium]|nr:glycosyltransferase family 39 protein [Bacteroidales bacterium]
MKKTTKTKKLKIHQTPVKNTFDAYLERPAYVFLFLFTLILLVYFKSFYGEAVFLDDDMMLENLRLLHIGNYDIIKESYSRDAMVGIGGDLYRPMQTFFLIFLYNIADGALWGMRLFQIFLHAASCFLMYLICCEISVEKRKSILLVLIFALHPLFVSLVSFIPAIGDLLLMTFGLASLLSFIHYLKKNCLWCLFASIVFYLFALFSKETAIGLPLVFFFVAILLRQKFLSVFKDRFLWIFLILVGFITFAYFFLRQIHVAPELIADHNKLNATNLLQNFLYNWPAFFEFPAKIIWPLNLSFLSSYSHMRLILSVLFFVLVFMLCIFKKTECKLLFLSLLWYAVFVIPPMLYKNPVFDYGEHRAYLPLAVWVFYFTSLKINTSLIKFLLIIPVFFAFMSFDRIKDFSAPMPFYDAIIANEDVPIAYLNRGAYRHKNFNDINGALDDYNKAIEIKADYHTALYNRAIIKSEELNDVEGALADLDKAIESKSNYADAYYHRGYVNIVKKNKVDEALADMDKAISFNPSFILAYNNRGLVHLNYKNDTLKALNDFSKSIEVRPIDNAQAYFNRALVFLRLEKKDKACLDFQTASQQGNAQAQQMYDSNCR